MTIRQLDTQARATQRRTIRSLHLSADLLQSRAGGLARYVDGLVRALMPTDPAQLVGIGSAKDPHAAAEASDSLAKRLLAVRKRAHQHLPEVDVVATHFALYASGCLGLLRTRPHVVHFHGPWAAESRQEGAGNASAGLKAFLERRVYGTAQRAIALSRAFAKILIEDYRVPEETVRVVPGGIDLPTSPLIDRAVARGQLGWPADRPIVLCVRRLARRMGLDVLIDAAREVRRRHPDALILIAGRGAIQDELRSQIESADLVEHVKLLGFVPDDQLALAYAAADVSIVPSQALEGFGLVTLESLVQGTPVLVTPVGGLPEVVADLDAGLLLPGAGAESIAAGLNGALSHRSSLPTRESCRNYAVARYAWPMIAKRVLSVYAEACSAFEGS